MRHSNATEMNEIGIVQDPADVLHRPTTPYELPGESALAATHFDALREAAGAVAALHQTRKGLGIAAPQLGLDRRIAIMRPWGGGEICLLNPVIIERSDETDLKYEGCLSVFDLRGHVERSLSITVRCQRFNGNVWEQSYTDAVARLIAHEIDHLDGVLYVDRMTEAPISADKYRELPDTDWTYR